MRFIIAILLLTVPVWGRPYHPPTPAQAASVRVAAGLSGADLDRVKVGNQAGILKIVGKDGHSEMFLKGSGTWNGGGIDGMEWARVSPPEREAMLTALDIQDVEAVAVGLINSYPRLSRVPAIALLGVLATPGKSNLSAVTQAKVGNFLRERLQPEEDPTSRRQAVLALALYPEATPSTVAAVVNFMRRDHNTWNTFTTVQFFEYHQTALAALPGHQKLLKDLAATDNPHAEEILRNFQSAAKAGP